MTPEEKIKKIEEIIDVYKLRNKRFEELTSFERRILDVVYPFKNKHDEKRWMGDYDNE